MTPVIVWLILRLLTSVFAGMVSSIKPITPLEILIPLFPPSAPIHEWLDRAFLSPWLRWDSIWYQQIVAQGYSSTDGTAQFHPLYAWLAIPLAHLGISPILSLMIVSSVAGIVLFYCFREFALLDLSSKDATFALMLFAFAPPSFVLFAPYPEALFLLAAVLCFLFMRKKSWWLAGVMGGLAALTRQQGIFLAIPMAWELWENADRKLKDLLTQWRAWLALGLIPLGMLVWLFYRAVLLDDLRIKTSTFQDFIYSFVISSSATQVVPNQQFLWPWQTLLASLQKLLTNPDMDMWVNISAAGIFLVMLAIAWKKLRLSYLLYTVAIAIISFSYYTGSIHPTMGLPRHLLLAFPVFTGLAASIKNTWLRLAMIFMSAIGMAFLLMLYVLKAWVP